METQDIAKRLCLTLHEPQGPRPWGYAVTTRQNSPILSKEKQDGHLDKSGSNFTLVHIANSQVQRLQMLIMLTQPG